MKKKKKKKEGKKVQRGRDRDSMRRKQERKEERKVIFIFFLLRKECSKNKIVTIISLKLIFHPNLYFASNHMLMCSLPLIRVIGYLF